MSETFAELLDESINSLDMKPGSIVSGVVLDAVSYTHLTLPTIYSV